MIILQKFGFKESRYERPKDKWLCGRLADGKPCSLGPGGDGSCRVTSVCQPHMEDGRWECRRSAQQGGACESGPLPDGKCCMPLERCVPQPSLRTQRRRWSLWATALTVGLVALILSGGAAKEYLMPGPLSQPHANLTDCETCHAGVKSDNLGWLHQFASTVSPKQNAELCLSCHDVGDQPFAPHTNPVEQLKKMTAAYRSGSKEQQIQNDSWVHNIAFPGPALKTEPADAQVYCATCHEEHQGLYNDLTTLSNDRCQTCHTSKFGSFASSHPKFQEYPFNRRTRIIFNHKSHFVNHIPKTRSKATPAPEKDPVCADCHQPGPAQKYMEIRSYESMCQSCHDKDILGTDRTDSKGIAFLSVPGLDVDTLTEESIDIGQWPTDHRSDATLTSFMKMLLPTESGAVSGIKDLRDLTTASADDLAKVKTLAWSIKRLFRNLENGGLPGAMNLSATPDSPSIDRAQIAKMAGMISRDVIAAVNQEWFNALDDDLKNFDENRPTKSFNEALESKKKSSDQVQSAPTSDAVQETGDDSLETDSGGLEEDDGSLEADSGGLEADSGSLEADSGGLEADSGSLEADSGGLEADSGSLEADSGGLEADSGSLEAESGGLEADNGSLETDSGGLEEATSEENSSEEAPKAAAAEPADPEAWAKFGGWYRLDHTIRYRPLGHSDQFLKAWLDFAGHAYGGENKAQLMPIFDQLTRNNAVGRCTKCHSVDEIDEFKQVKWKAFSARRVESRFTKFSHDAHISAVGSKGCVSCHQLSTSKIDEYEKTYTGGDPHKYDQNFVTLDKQLCATCHTEQSAGETCTLCHKYHSTEFDKPLVKTGLPTKLPSPK